LDGINSQKCLIAIGEPAHTTHNSEYVVVNSVYLGDTIISGGAVGGFNVKGSVINSGEVASTRWLVIFWFKSK
tara:strand:- start:1 stop:219 length:219 start_codon:yes stop_codon:yes gene_type:complete